eukprot:6468439-Amphidinium_carterae.1
MDAAAWLEPLQGAILKLPPFQAAAVANQAAYGAWCQHRLWQRHMSDHPNCLLCGGEGTVFHRMMTCPVWAPMRCKALSAQTQTWVMELPELEQQCIADLFVPQTWNEVPRPLDGSDVRWTTEPCWLTGDIFMDGAAFNPKSSALRRAGWALCQVGCNGELVAGVYGYLPHHVSWEQQVRDAEDYCAVMLARFARGTVRAYTD